MQLTPFKHEIKNYAENLRSTESFRLSDRQSKAPFAPTVGILPITAGFISGSGHHNGRICDYQVFSRPRAGVSLKSTNR
jgi:hypothetical protein